MTQDQLYTRMMQNSTPTSDGWHVDVDHDAAKVPVPSFIRLFTIRRVVDFYVDKNNTSGQTSNTIIKNLVNKSITNKAAKSTVDDILFKLMHFGIKLYMELCYKEEEQSSMIEMIFNQIILNHMAKEYQHVITYQESCNKNEDNMNNNYNSNYDNYCRESVFNTTDLMCSIFQYAEYKTSNEHFTRRTKDYHCDLVNLSLVCSHWLYHAYNPKSIYFFNLTRLIEITQRLYKPNYANININDDDVDEYDDVKIYDFDINSVRRMWQRLINVRKVRIDVCSKFFPSQFKKEKISHLLLSRLSMLGNVKWIQGSCVSSGLVILKAIIQNCRKKIERYDVYINHYSHIDNSFNPQVLKLWNANYISIGFFPLRILWSNTCNNLRLGSVKPIDEKWCDYVIDNCDCSGIKTLTIYGSQFDERYFDVKNKSTQVLFAKLANKFENLNKLTIDADYHKFDECVFLFLRLLQRIMCQNDTKVELFVGTNLEESKYDTINDCIQKSKAKIDRIKFYWAQEKQFKHMNKLLKESNTLSKLEWLGIENWDHIDDNEYIIASVINFLDNIVVKVSPALELQVLQIEDDLPYIPNKSEPMNDISQLLTSDFINEYSNSGNNNTKNKNKNKNKNNSVKKDGLFIIVNVQVVLDPQITKENFDIFCSNVFSLMVTKRMPIDIKIEFVKSLDNYQFDDHYNQIYLSYFDQQKVLRQYKLPKCNKYCSPLQCPRMLFEYVGDQMCVFHVVNVERYLD